MTKDDAAVNLSLKAARCLGNLSDLHCSRDWKCAANRRFQLIKPNLLILRPSPICGEQAMCPREAGHPLNTALAPPRPVVFWLLVGRGHLLTATEGGHYVLGISVHSWRASWEAEERDRQRGDRLPTGSGTLTRPMLSPCLSPLLKEIPFLRIGNKPGATCYKCGLLNPPHPFFSPH